MNGLKDLFISACGIIGSLISAALGRFDNGMITLIIFMAIDYIIGLSAYTLTIGITNLSKLTEEQIVIATSKTGH